MTTSRFRVLRRDEPDYPRAMRRLPDAPAKLWVAGDLEEAVRVAVVGSRACSAYGRRVARRLALDLAAAGVVVVSGMARGIDAAAHRGALEAGGRTVAVLPGGLDRPYPPRHAALARGIARSGALVSEQPPGTTVAPWSFPRRNRIIAALAEAVVIVEAAERSGARITADLALDYGREVLVVPGPVISPTSAGCHRLLADGAQPCTSAADVLRALPEHALEALERRPRQSRATPAGPLPPAEARLLACCRRLGRARIDVLLAAAGLDLPALLGLLTELEMRGLLSVNGDIVEAVETPRRAGTV